MKILRERFCVESFCGGEHFVGTFLKKGFAVMKIFWDILIESFCGGEDFMGTFWWKGFLEVKILWRHFG